MPRKTTPKSKQKKSVKQKTFAKPKKSVKPTHIIKKNKNSTINVDLDIDKELNIELLTQPISFPIPKNVLFLNLINNSTELEKHLNNNTTNKKNNNNLIIDTIYFEYKLNNKIDTKLKNTKNPMNLKSLDVYIELLKKIIVDPKNNYSIKICCTNMYILFNKLSTFILNYNVKFIIPESINKENDLNFLNMEIKKFYKKKYKEFLTHPNIIKSINTSLLKSSKYYNDEFSNVFDKLNKNKITINEIKNKYLEINNFNADESENVNIFEVFKSLVYFGIFKERRGIFSLVMH